MMMSNLTRNDPYPVYTTADPHTLLTREYRAERKEEITYGVGEWFRFSATMFRQRASSGTNINCQKYTELGDLEGRWNQIALLYPEADGNTDIQTALRDALNLEDSPTCFQIISDPYFEDVKDEFGRYSVPICYRKIGARFELELSLGWDFGLVVQGGVSDIKQTATFIDLTCSATGLSCPVIDCLETCSGSSDPDATTGTTCTPSSCCIDVFNCDCKKLVMNHIMKQLCKVSTTLDLNTDNFHRTAPEDTRVGLYWRHPYDVNFGYNENDWASVIITPFVTGEFSAPTGRIKCEKALFDLPSGNNGHWAYGFDVGVSFDFLETVGLVFEGGMTKFHKRIHCQVPVPTNCFQAGMFPRKANLCIEPGTNWNFGITLDAYHFLDRLSFWGQYVLVDHNQDCISITSVPDGTNKDNLLIGMLKEQSNWRVHMANLAGNYDISPNVALGFLWQAPIKQYNAYQSTTIMGSITITW